VALQLVCMLLSVVGFGCNSFPVLLLVLKDAFMLVFFNGFVIVFLTECT